MFKIIVACLILSLSIVSLALRFIRGFKGTDHLDNGATWIDCIIFILWMVFIGGLICSGL